MRKLDAEKPDAENPEWTDEELAGAIPFSALPDELQALLASPKTVSPEPETTEKRQPAA